MTASTEDRRLRSLRPPKPDVDPWAAHGSIVEDERRPDGSMERALTIFLSGSECPFTCSFCDLWKWTFDGPTPRGALTQQIRGVVSSLARPLPERVKLYNASNWFDKRAVPPDDLPDIVDLVRPFGAVTVEAHASLVGDATLEFADSIQGRLEVAMGLETIHPEAMRHLNKRLTLERFEKAARFLADNGIDLRVFVIIGLPYVPVDESVEWAVQSARFAAERGAAVVSIIPARGGNGEMERLLADGHFLPPRLAHLEAALDRCLRHSDPEQREGEESAVVFTADLWDVELLASCATCRDQRVARMRRLNVTGKLEPEVICLQCRGR